MAMENEAIKSEEIIFYLDLITDFVKKKTLLKGIKNFIDTKKKLTSESTFGIVMFQGERNPMCIYDMSDFDPIKEGIEDAWDGREMKQSFFENGIFEILSYIFGKSKSIKRYYRVIVISDSPSLRSEDYHRAAYDLIVKSKNFSTFIDVIRLGDEKFYPDEVKLKILSSETQGGTFFVNDNKHFLDVLGSLVKSKREFNIIAGIDDDSTQIFPEDKTFYEKLAVDLITLDPGEDEICTKCEQEMCPICEAYSDEIHKCYNCGAKFHGCCAAQYAITHNVGFRHIFRCPQCESLLKLDEEFVNLIYVDEFGGEIEGGLVDEEDYDDTEIDSESKYSYDIYDEKADGEPQVQEQELEQTIEDRISPKENLDDSIKLDKIIQENVIIEEETGVSPEQNLEVINEEEQIIEQKVETENIQPPPKPVKTKKVKVGGYFGSEIEIREKEKVKKIESKKPSKVTQENISITKLSPPKKKLMKFCKICGSTVREVLVCPNCGAKID